jgi:hypothetical protein
VNPLRVLHIGNTAGVASILAYYMDKLKGTRSMVIQIRRNDPFGQTFYGKTTASNSLWFYACSMAHALRADFIHVHARGAIVPHLKQMGLHPILLHYHGTDIRERWCDPIRKAQYRDADRIVVSTGDLLEGSPEGTLWIKNPVHVERFTRTTEPPTAERAFTITYNADAEAKEIAERWGIPLDILPRNIPYAEMPRVMSWYTHFVEIKRDEYGRMFPTKGCPYESLTSLEARAMGLTVLRVDERLQGLPEEYHPSYAVDKFYNLYLEMLNR